MEPGLASPRQAHSHTQTEETAFLWLEEGFRAHRHLSCPLLPSPLGAEAWNSTIRSSFLWLGIQTSQ